MVSKSFSRFPHFAFTPYPQLISLYTNFPYPFFSCAGALLEFIPGKSALHQQRLSFTYKLFHGYQTEAIHGALLIFSPLNNTSIANSEERMLGRALTAYCQSLHNYSCCDYL
jgi:hypothetical protein